jgi:hypothetical protein
MRTSIAACLGPHRGRWIALGLSVLLLTPAQARAPLPLLRPWVHPGAAFIRANGYHGASTCAACHAQALSEVLESVHWTLASPVRNVVGLPEGSWWGMANRQCALAGCMAAANWLAATHGRFTPQSQGCGVCHIGALSAPPMPGRPPTAAHRQTVDCLVCHAKHYDWSRRARRVRDASGVHWGEDTSVRSALSITRVPTNAACLRCHEHAFSADYKRGTPFTVANDVHARAGLRCVTCHLTEHHKIAKGQVESDMVANDRPDVPVRCSGCHGPSPHTGARAAILNAHIRRLACQTCHIPQVSGIVYENWGEPVRDDAHGRHSALSKYDPSPALRAAFVPTVRIERGPPQYEWRVANTAEQPAAQSWMAFATSTRDTPGARLYPVRALTQVMLFDRTRKMWQAPGMSGLRRDPQSAEFPLLLTPNREVYNRTGSVQQALAAGMRALGVPWSGQWRAMQVPGISYISVNHGIRTRGLACIACHSRHGVMDFKRLGYSAQQIRQLEQAVRPSAR